MCKYVEEEMKSFRTAKIVIFAAKLGCVSLLELGFAFGSSDSIWCTSLVQDTTMPLALARIFFVLQWRLYMRM